MKHIAPLLLLSVGVALAGSAQASSIFLPGNLVVSVEGNGVMGAASGAYTDNQASPLTLFSFSHNGTSSASYAGALVLPQTASGANSAFSGEYGSSSEGGLQLTGDGKSLVIMGYGVNAATFNANPTSFGTLTNDPTKPTALGQSGSLTGQGYTPVPRVVAVIGANGSVDTSTSLTGVFNGNNPRSVASVDGTSFYISGQGTSPDSTGGVFYATKGSHSATAITGNDTNKNGSAQDTRIVEIHNNQLYVSADSKEGKNNNRDFIGTLGAPGALPTTLANGGNGPTALSGFGNSGGTGKVTITAATSNGINLAGKEINLSPESFFFANDTTLYVADSGVPKNDSAANDSIGSPVGDGGLQKWSLIGNTWTLDYTLADGLNLVANSAAAGTTGLLGLTGQVIDGNVQLFATNYTVGDTDQTYLFGITDVLAALSKPTGEQFSILATAPADSTFKGVAFAPSAGAVPEPATWAMLIAGFGLVGAVVRRRKAAVFA